MSPFLKFFQKKATGPSIKKRGLLEKVNLKRVRPYGDVLDDGAMQLSFTLPVEASRKAQETAKLYVEEMGLKDVHVASMESVGSGFSFFVVYAQARHSINFTRVKVPKAKFIKMDFKEVQAFAREKFKRRLVVIGATTGTDAHTVGIDAIMNMKGYLGDYGLERYSCFRTINLRSQVDNEELVKQALRHKADAILVSKVVTQRGKHLQELKSLAKLLKANKKLTTPLIKIVGGPRLTHAQATKLGFDAGFGPGTLPSEVASFLVQEYARRMK